MKVSEKQILEIFENNEDCKPKSQLAVELGITVSSLNRRLAKMKHKVRDRVQEIVEKNALQYIGHLVTQSHLGKTEATKILLELSKIKSKDSILPDDGGNWKISIEKITPDKAE